jgi:predicted O-linked N-acetylglucosamine transferase (SPINDLY family)
MNDTIPADIASVLQRLTELLKRGAYGDAVQYASLARRQFPVAYELIRLQGIALLKLGHRREAQTALNRAAELAPGNIELQCLLARLALDEGKIDAALQRLHGALRLAPGHSETLHGLGTAWAAAGRFEQSRNAFADAVKGAPQHPGVRLNLAAAELELGNIAEAEAQVSAALQMAPTFDAAHTMFAHLMYLQHRPKEAGAALLQAGKLAPKNAQHLFQAGLMLDEAGDLGGACAAFAEALKRDPDSMPALGQLLYARRRLCDWHQLDEYSDRVQSTVDQGEPGIHPFAFLAEDANAAQQLVCARTFANLIDQQVAPLRQQLGLRHKMPTPEAPIRIGFVADGFNDHLVGLQTVALFEALAQSDLDVHLFATTADDGSVIRRRLAAATTLHDIATIDRKEIARRIDRAGIEILFDLNGYCGRSNAKLMALRAAPIQVSWLGSPGSSGAAWMDYVLADDIVLPTSLREHFSEKVVCMPRCFQPNDTTRVLHAPPSRLECGLPESGVVFACFGETYALNPAVFARCMLILQQVPASVLWLQTGSSGADDRLRKAAAALDVAPERLVFMPRLFRTDYLARYAHVDLFLDTLPWSAQAAAADALWAGCPVLTRAGDTFAGRTVASLLSHLGLPELITEDGVSFIGMAVALGGDPEALGALRRHLVQQRTISSLFDTQGLADDFRRAVRAISARYRIGRPPIDLNL